ncbi:MAG: chondroitinase-B domain-containing protein [Niabella sp.]
MKGSMAALLISLCTVCSVKDKTAVVPESESIRVITVTTAAELKAALSAAKPGDSIVLKDAVYPGKFVIENSGNEKHPIVLIGSRNAVLDAGNITTGYVLQLKASYWHLRGFTLKSGLKGLMTDSASNNIIDGILVTQIGEEGVHFRTFSSHNIIQNSTINNTGLNRPGYGEGIYIGSAKNNWEKYTAGKPDRCDDNKVLNNTIGPNITAECIDVKEGTTGGLIDGNTFNSEGVSGENSADSWMDIKGNDYRIENNKGINPSAPSFLDGYQVNCAYTGWGNNNVFKHNISEVNAPGYAINVKLKSSNGEVTGTVVYADNTAQHAGKGISNIPLTQIK